MRLPISELVTLPEGKTLEFKRDVSSPKNILKSLVAFANTAGGVLFAVYLANPIAVATESHAVKETISEPGKQVTEQVTEQVISLVICLENKALGRKEVMQLVGISSRPTFVYDYLQPAIQAGLVEMTQPDSPKSPTQKYRLTAKGRKYLQEKRG